MNSRGAWLVFLVFAISTSSMAQQKTSPPHWTYTGAEGPEHWGDLDPSFTTCKTGKEQSPIDIRNPQKASLPRIQFDYQPAPLKIIDNGHSIQVNYSSGSTITVGDHKYELKQFHFHHPSEEKINGQPSDMVAHLVHADAEGKLAVVAVLLKKGQANSAIQTIWDHLPREKGVETPVEGITINAADLLPEKLGYYTFAGSLTTPPCTEGVTWYVLKSSKTLSAQQVDAFAKPYPMNARPTQPLNGRVVKETE
ncbi:MAG TPA: carbonic anhydrase family protein [Terriglobales bacterium]|nr:carbonic anhydrase family protein [Terriglobales bacterium]